MPALGRDRSKPAPLSSTELLLAHEPVDPVSPVPMTALSQRHLDTRRPIGLPAVLVDLGNLQFKGLVLLEPLTSALLPPLPVVVAAGRDFQRLAQSPNRVLSFHGVDALEPFWGVSERMPNVFFKMSRCRRRYSFSCRNAAFCFSRSSADGRGVKLGAGLCAWAHV